MRLAVPLLIKRGIPQPEIGCEVNNPGCKPGIFFNVMLRLPMWLGQEQHIYRLQGSRIAEFKLGLLSQIRVDLVYVLSQMGAGCHLLDLYIWMSKQQPQQLSAAVTGSADDG
jgi:hypothetical protein